MIRYLLAAHRGKAIAAVIALTALVGFAVLGIVLPADHGATPHADPSSTTLTGTGPNPTTDPGTQAGNVLSGQELAELDAAPSVAPVTSALLPPIPAQTRMQPDLYARAFLTALFVHPYAGVTRGDMLAWVQAQQATSSYITGGTPEQLNRLLVESASDPAWSNHGFAALPDEPTWTAASAGWMAVSIQKLTCITPPEWEAAIAAGTITDPGLTERLVSADLRMTLTQHGHRVTQTVSVALTLLLEGPPTLSQFGVVVIADTNVVQAP